MEQPEVRDGELANPSAGYPANMPTARRILHHARVRRLLRLSASLLTAAGVLVIDQITKGLAQAYLLRLPDLSIPIAGDFLRLTYVANRGAAFGILQEQTVFFVVVSGLVITLIIASYRYFPMSTTLLSLALGLQLGGALGNLMDRIRHGYVVDFIDVSIWPVFNVADSAIVTGVGILALHLMWSPDRRERRPRG